MSDERQTTVYIRALCRLFLVRDSLFPTLSPHIVLHFPSYPGLFLVFGSGVGVCLWSGGMGMCGVWLPVALALCHDLAFLLWNLLPNEVKVLISHSLLFTISHAICYLPWMPYEGGCLCAASALEGGGCPCAHAHLRYC
jgi:hypothetical protein